MFLTGFYSIYERVVSRLLEAETQTFVLCTFSSPPAVFSVDAVCVFSQNFLNSSSCPEIQGYLYLKEPGRKSWKKLYMFLRRSGLYYSTKGTSKVMDYCCTDSETNFPVDTFHDCLFSLFYLILIYIPTLQFQCVIYCKKTSTSCKKKTEKYLSNLNFAFAKVKYM